MKLLQVEGIAEDLGRSPQGERGLKSDPPSKCVHDGRRSPQGERGLKFPPDAQYQTLYGRSPQGERGLKYVLREGLKVPGLVALRKESVD